MRPRSGLDVFRMIKPSAPTGTQTPVLPARTLVGINTMQQLGQYNELWSSRRVQEQRTRNLDFNFDCVKFTTTISVFSLLL